MSDTNKALAVDFTKTFISATSAITDANGKHIYTFKIADVEETLKQFYKIIKELD